jgi:hypothetical protein
MDLNPSSLSSMPPYQISITLTFNPQLLSFNVSKEFSQILFIFAMITKTYKMPNEFFASNKD